MHAVKLGPVVCSVFVHFMCFGVLVERSCHLQSQRFGRVFSALSIPLESVVLVSSKSPCFFVIVKFMLHVFCLQNGLS